jgi:hypothetical protein
MPSYGGESLVNLVAERLLVPGRWFESDARTAGYDLEELVSRYPTAAPELIAWQLLELPEPCVITVVNNGHVQKRRSNAWRVRRELVPAERQCQEYVHHYSRPHQTREGGWTVHGWPVHRSDWKKEILRSVCDEDGESF